MRSILMVFLLVSSTANAIPPGTNGADDDPSELLSGKHCFFSKKIPHNIGEKIKRNALKGDSIAAMFLADNLGFIEGFEEESRNDWLSTAEENGNPLAYISITYNLLRMQKPENFPNAITRLKISAEQGFLGGIDILASIYSGEEEGFEAYKNDSLANYWRERSALAGNLFNLKEFVIDNPNNLSEGDLWPWQQAFEFINTKSTKRKVFPMSSDAKWLVNIFKNNKQNLIELLKKYDVVYSEYKYCKYNSLTRKKM